MIVSDNGTELTSNTVPAWSGDTGVEGPTQNGFVEGLGYVRFGLNGRLCDELLPETLCFTIGRSTLDPCPLDERQGSHQPASGFSIAILASPLTPPKNLSF